jgi:hypothetical protein
LDKGIVILALGNSNYGRMALNLSVSIRANNPELSERICLLHSKGMLEWMNQNERAFFDDFIEVDEILYTYKGNKEYQMAKTAVYDLSPYKRTVYLDADSIWLPTRKTKDLFHECWNNPVLFQCVSEWDIQKEWGCLWTVRKEGPNDGLKQIREIYGITDHRTIYEMQSSFLYFEKSRVAKAFFDTAKECYIKRPFHFYEWNAGIPDELVFNISTAINNIKLPRFPLTPLFFTDYTHSFKGDPSRDCNFGNRKTIFDRYYILSMAGNVNSASSMDLYNSMVKSSYAMYPSKIRFPYMWKQKRQFLTTRQAA